MNRYKDIKIDHNIARTLDDDLIICDGDSCTFDEIDGLWDEIDSFKPETLTDQVTKLFFPASYKRMKKDKLPRSQVTKAFIAEYTKMRSYAAPKERKEFVIPAEYRINK